MGLNKADIISGTNCFMAQRLVRRLCSNCKQKEPIKDSEKAIIEKALKAISPKFKAKLKVPDYLYVAKGCEKCNKTGFKGRVSIMEILEIDDEMEKFLSVASSTEGEIEGKAIENGMLSMFQDGVISVIMGKTTLSEILREVEAE
jgi:type II secretory ATPase GspE/PulE/Tfp pilus assembly ATPase PilB-like protein